MPAAIRMAGSGRTTAAQRRTALARATTAPLAATIRAFYQT